MNKARLEEVLNNCIGYLVELKKHESTEEQNMFWKNIIGLTNEEMKELDLTEEQNNVEQ